MSFTSEKAALHAAKGFQTSIIRLLKQSIVLFVNDVSVYVKNPLVFRVNFHEIILGIFLRNADAISGEFPLECDCELNCLRNKCKKKRKFYQFTGRLTMCLRRRYQCGKCWVPFPSRSNRTQSSQRLATVAMFLRSCVVRVLGREDGPRHSLHTSTLIPRVSPRFSI